MNELIPELRALLSHASLTPQQVQRLAVLAGQAVAALERSDAGTLEEALNAAGKALCEYCAEGKYPRIYTRHGVFGHKTIPGDYFLPCHADKALNAIRALKSHPLHQQDSAEWVRVKDRLPEGVVRVITLSTTGTVDASWSTHVRELYAAGVREGDGCYFTHWRPLPKPPLSAVSTEGTDSKSSSSI